MRKNPVLEARILVLAEAEIDAAPSLGILRDAGLVGNSCLTIAGLAAEIEAGAGAVLIPAEMLSPAGFEVFRAAIQSQPAWSDVPVIALMRDDGPTKVSGHFLKDLTLSGNVTLLDLPVRPASLLSVLRCALTARKRQYEMRDLLGRYKTATDSAAAATRAKSCFLANISHEIRTPLNAIIGFSDLLLEGATTPDERVEFLATIRRNGTQLTQVIDDILDLSKVEAGRLAIERVPTALARLMAEVTVLMRQQAGGNGVTLTMSAAPDVPATIDTDPTRLRQVLLNIVGNAVKFTAKGAIDVRLALATTAGAPRLAFTVKDTGRGIAAEHQRLLFTAFTQADVSSTRKFGGTGLGLVLSRRLAEALGGGLELTASKAGCGSTFTIEVAVHGASGSFNRGLKNAPVVGAPPLTCRQDLLGVSVLVVEDAADNQLLMHQILSRCGADVDLAANGVEGIRMAMSHDYDIVLMDVHMPVKDGLEATAELRRRGYAKPILAVSAAARGRERDQALSVGCDDHVTKPINVGALLEKVGLYARRGAVPGPRGIRSGPAENVRNPDALRATLR